MNYEIKAMELEWENDLAEGTALPEAGAAEKKARFKAKKAVKNAKRKRSRMEANL